MEDLRELLVDGVIVKTRGKVNAIVLADRLLKFENICDIVGLTGKKDYNTDLTDDRCNTLDIMEIYKIKTMYQKSLQEILDTLDESCIELIWKREKEPVTFEEVLKNPDKKSKGYR